MIILETERLLLRTFKDDDLKPFATINQDPKVMAFFPSLQNTEQTKQLINRINEHQSDHGFTLYAVVIKSTEQFIGFTGLMTPSFDAHFTPAIEIGWRLNSNHWNNGYATEAAKAVIQHAFTKLCLTELVSFTAQINTPSRRVMEKIGMHHDIKDDFNHPSLSQDSPLYRHVLTRLSKKQFINQTEQLPSQ